MPDYFFAVLPYCRIAELSEMIAVLIAESLILEINDRFFGVKQFCETSCFLKMRKTLIEYGFFENFEKQMFAESQVPRNSGQVFAESQVFGDSYSLSSE